MMLILTKEEVCERITCFEKLIGVYNKKIEFLQKLLVYFDKSGRNMDCLVVNVNLQASQEDIFTDDDHIQFIKEESKIMNDYENNISFNSNPSSVTNTAIPKNPSTTIFSPKTTISSDLLHKNINGNHSYHSSINAENTSFTTLCTNSKSSNSLLLASSSDEFRKNVFIVPKLEAVKETNDQIEHMEGINSHLEDVEIKLSKKSESVFLRPNSTSTFISPSDLKAAANIFLSETDVDPAEMPSLTSTLNCNIEKNKEIKVKQFQCEICHSAFAQKGVLNRHKILRHSPVVNKPHICPNCRKAFTLKHHLKNHLKCKSGCRSTNEFNI